MKSNDEIMTEFKKDVVKHTDLIFSAISNLFGKVDCIHEQVTLGAPSQDGILTSSLVLFFSNEDDRSELAYFFTNKRYVICNTLYWYRPRYIIQDAYPDKHALGFDFRVPATEYNKQVN
jgi:hypothetical protein